MNRLLITIGLLVVIALSIEYYETLEISRDEQDKVNAMIIDDPETMLYFEELYWPKSYLTHRDLHNLRMKTR